MARPTLKLHLFKHAQARRFYPGWKMKCRGYLTWIVQKDPAVQTGSYAPRVNVVDGLGNARSKRPMWTDF
jgi:hypothetical protein